MNAAATTITDLQKRALDAIRSLRHFSVLDAQDIAVWLSVVLLRDPQRVLWHIERLNGTSASTVVDYVLHQRGERPDVFGRPARIADAERLMKSVPKASTEPMRRGTLLEPVLEAFFLRTQKGRFTKNVSALEATRSQVGTRECPSLRASLDTILTTTNAGRRWEIAAEYKCPALDPSEDEGAGLEDEPVRLRYVCQLHAQVMVAHAAGQTINGMSVVNLICPPAIASAITDDLEAAHANGTQQQAIERAVEQLIVLSQIGGGRLVRAAVQPVKFSIDLAREIVRAANAADARIQRGEMAPWPSRPKLELSEAQAETISRLQVEVASALAMEEAASLRATSLKQALAETVKDHLSNLASLKGEAPLLALSAPASLKAEDAIDYLLGQHIDLNQITKPSALSEARVAELCAAHGVALDDLRDPRVPNNDEIRKALKAQSADLIEQFSGEPSLRVGLTKAKSGPAVDTLDSLRQRARQMVEQASSWGAGDTDPSAQAQAEWTDDFFEAAPDGLSP